MIATQRTTIEGTAAADILTGSYKVKSILVTNNTASPIVAEISDSSVFGSSRSFYVAVDAFQSELVDNEYLADMGVRLNNAPGANVHITVFHGAVGA